MKKEKKALEEASLKMHEYFWSRTENDNLLETARKKRELVEAWQEAQRAYEKAYAETMRNKFLDLGDVNEAV